MLTILSVSEYRGGGNLFSIGILPLSTSVFVGKGPSVPVQPLLAEAVRKVLLSPETELIPSSQLYES